MSEADNQSFYHSGGSTPGGAADLTPCLLSSCGCCGHSEAWPWLPGYANSDNQLCRPLSGTSPEYSNLSGILHGSAPSGSCLALVDHTASTITSSFRSLLSQIMPCGVGRCFPGTDTQEWNCGIIGYILRWSLIYLQSHDYQFILYFCIARLMLKIIKLYQVGQSDGCETYFSIAKHFSCLLTISIL